MEKIISIVKHYMTKPYNCIDLSDDTLRYSLNVDDTYLYHQIIDYINKEFSLNKFKNVKLEVYVNIYDIRYDDIKNICKIKVNLLVKVYFNNQYFNLVTKENIEFEKIPLYIKYKECEP